MVQLVQGTRGMHLLRVLGGGPFKEASCFVWLYDINVSTFRLTQPPSPPSSMYIWTTFKPTDRRNLLVSYSRWEQELIHPCSGACSECVEPNDHSSISAYTDCMQPSTILRPVLYWLKTLTMELDSTPSWTHVREFLRECVKNLIICRVHACKPRTPRAPP